MPQSLPGTLPSGDSTPTAPELPPLSPTACRKATSMTIVMPTATMGAVNRPGNSAPTVNATAQIAIMPTTPTMTGHTGAVPQVAADEMDT